MNFKLLLSIVGLINVASAAKGPHGAPLCNGCTVTGTGGDLSLWGWENNTACEIDSSKCNSNSATDSSSNATKVGPHGAPLCNGCTVTGTGGDESLWGWENNTACEIDTSKCSSSSSSSSSSNNSSSNNNTSTYVSSGNKKTGKTTRYWDCCKPSCAWPGKANVSHPVNTCNRSGSVLSDTNSMSGCDGGESFMCTGQQPWAINDNLSYGFAAASIAGSSESAFCCACYKLTFTSTAIAGKEMIVQVTNTGGDLGENHFDIQIPGGGLGIFDGCSTQFNTNAASWGERYGGVRSESQCSNLPTSLQAGCKWRFGWFKNADNPTMEFEEVECPAAIIAKSGCSRL